LTQTECSTVLGVPASLQTQLVLYEHRPATIQRAVEGLCAAVRHARARGPLDHRLTIGDCSADRCLAAADVDALASTSASEGAGSVTYEHFGENLGSAGGSNRLAKDASAELLLVLNPDTYAAPSMLSELLAALSDDGVGVAEGRQIPLEHPKAFDPATGDTSWASGCCTLVRRSVFDEVDGYDAETFPLYCDDVDFSWRVRVAGHRVVHVPGAVLFHDKRIGAVDGRPVTAPSGLEVYWSVLARLLLATKWGRPDVVATTLSASARSDDPDIRRGVDDYEERRRAGRLPAVQPDAARVAEFVGGAYGPHRF